MPKSLKTSDHTIPEILALRKVKPVFVMALIVILSVIMVVALLWIIYGGRSNSQIVGYAVYLPVLNAILNFVSTILLLIGYYMIRRRHYLEHMKLMIAAFIVSSLFLISYIIYHNIKGHTTFDAEGWISVVYFFILISHIFLSIFVIPMCLFSFYFAFSHRFVIHRKLSKYTFGIWLYVSITGVLIFLLLRLYGT